MSQKHSILTLSVLAAAALTAETFVDLDGAVATAGASAGGVACTDGAIGDLVPVDVLGTAIVTASAAIAKGAYLQVAADGKAVTQTTGIAVAQALEAASADGDRIEVMLIPSAPAPSA